MSRSPLKSAWPIWLCLWLFPALSTVGNDEERRQQLIDSWLGETEGSTLSRRRLTSQGATLLARIDAICRLSEPQRRKLQWALDADLRRLDRAIEAAREELEALVPVGVELDKVRTDRELAQVRARIVSPLQQLRQALLGPDSLVLAAQPAVLLPEQQREWELHMASRARRLQHGLLEHWIIEQDRDLPMTERHRAALQEQLLESIRLPEGQENRAGNAIQAQLRQLQPESLFEIYSPAELALIRRLERAAVDQFKQLQAAGNAP